MTANFRESEMVENASAGAPVFSTKPLPIRKDRLDPVQNRIGIGEIVE